jgi:hypothetical protein
MWPSRHVVCLSLGFSTKRDMYLIKKSRDLSPYFYSLYYEQKHHFPKRNMSFQLFNYSSSVCYPSKRHVTVC